jgi:hypothetical protein
VAQHGAHARPRKRRCSSACGSKRLSLSTSVALRKARRWPPSERLKGSRVVGQQGQQIGVAVVRSPASPAPKPRRMDGTGASPCRRR